MLLSDLLSWATNPENEHVFWLNGMAGTGKTTVAETFCNLLFREGLLGSSFFCSRKNPDRRNVRLIIPALAKGLACVYPEFQAELLKVLKDDRDFTGLGLEDQYLTLILQPAKEAFTRMNKTIVLVVDALDECEDAQAVEMFLNTVLLQKPTCGLQLLVTSRPEYNILNGFSSGAYASLRLQDIEAHIVKADIAVFLNNKLKEIKGLYAKYSSMWPPAEVQTIVDQAGTLFIYAATAVKYISDHKDHVGRMTKFASIQPPANAVQTIDKVYEHILAEAFNPKMLDDEEIAWVKSCLSMVVCAIEPMSVNTYSILLGITADQVRGAFSSLHSVVQVPESEQDSELIMLFHASFSDYLLSNTRSDSKPWLIYPARVHSDIGDLCMKIMMSKLHFNIAQASTSYKSNVDQALQVAPYWNYVAIHWATHITYCIKPLERLGPSLVQIIVQFLEEKYLYWLEVLSVLNKIQVAPAVLLTLSKMVATGSDLETLCSEFASFSSSYLVPIQTSVPHIYLSALSWVSPKSRMKSLYSPLFSHLLLIHDQSKTHGHQSLLLQLIGHQHTVTCVAFASNSAFIVSGSEDKTVRVWNVMSGRENLKPFCGHTDEVTSVAISPDCQLVASASKDKSFRVWDAATGQSVWKPLQEHTGKVSSVVFSSNGKFLLSVSGNTIYLWDAKQGGKLLKTFKPRSYIHAIAFSSDCNTLASVHGVDIYLWNVSTGQIISKLSTSLYSVSSTLEFSPNNAELLVAIYRGLGIWNIQSGKLRQFHIRHTEEITSAAYSKDGKYIVSGSRDCTVRLWDAATGKEICRPLQGHSSWVTSVTFSEDGKYIASASWDNTVRVWNAQTTDIFQPAQGHSSGVKSAIFSPRDEYVLSYSGDKTIYVWDLKTGELKIKPLVGHCQGSPYFPYLR
jgi:WD40 repeat protein